MIRNLPNDTDFAGDAFDFFGSKMPEDVIVSEICGNLDLEETQLLRAATKRMYLLIPHARVNLCNFGASIGSIPICVWGLYYGSDDMNISTVAARYGHTHVLKWAINMFCPWNTVTIIAAAKSGNLSTLEYIVGVIFGGGGFITFSNAYMTAAKYGHAHVMDWLNDKIVELSSQNPNFEGDFARDRSNWEHNICVIAARYGRTNILIWSYKKLGHVCQKSCKVAARHGHLETLKAITPMCDTRDTDIIRCAVKGGHFEVIQWAFANGYPAGDYAVNTMCELGHLDMFRWIMERGFPRIAKFLESAAERGHLHILKWAASDGFNAGTLKVLTAAVFGRQLEVVQWLRSIGCPWDVSISGMALVREDTRTLRWLMENGCPWDFTVEQVRSCDPRVRAYIRSRGLRGN